MLNNTSNEKLVFGVAETGKMLGMGLSATYEALRAGQIPSVRIGRRWMIPRQALLEMLECGGGS